MSKSEEVLQALLALLQGIAGVAVVRNQDREQRLPEGGLLILWDGEPGEPEVTLGGNFGAHYSHQAQVEVHVQHADADTREVLFDDLVMAVDAALTGDATLGGLAHGLMMWRPTMTITPVEGEGAIKSGKIPLTIEYDTTSMLG